MRNLVLLFALAAAGGFILPGDRVRCELSPYDLDRARIVYRHR